MPERSSPLPPARKFDRSLRLAAWSAGIVLAIGLLLMLLVVPDTVNDGRSCWPLFNGFVGRDYCRRELGAMPGVDAAIVIGAAVVLAGTFVVRRRQIGRERAWRRERAIRRLQERIDPDGPS